MIKNQQTDRAAKARSGTTPLLSMRLEACSLIDNPDFDPAQTVGRFMAYRGVTAAGLAAMTEAGLADAVGSGLQAAARAVAAMTETNDK